jgi:tRNA(Ile)-lysidine synthase
LVERGSTVLLAVSGGPDSMALLHVMARLGARLGFFIVAHGVDHGLREEAAAELEMARGLALRLGVPMETTRVNVAPGGNLQARARTARLEALRAAAAQAGATRIATGHHADDRAETVVMRLLQGSGPRGLGCLPPRDGELIRPLLLARRQDILAHLLRHRLPFAEDPSNNNSRFLRARVRGEVMPLLERLSPSIVSHLNALADALVLARISGESGGNEPPEGSPLEPPRTLLTPPERKDPGDGHNTDAPGASNPEILRYGRATQLPSCAGDESSSTAGLGGGKLAEMARSEAEEATGPAKVRS